MFLHSTLFLDRSDGVDDLGGLQWRVVLSLLGTWALVCLCMIRGIKSTGKVSYTKRNAYDKHLHVHVHLHAPFANDYTPSLP